MKDLREVKAKRRAMLERVAIYLLGVAIGCVLLGFYYNGRQQAVQRQQAQQQVPATPGD